MRVVAVLLAVIAVSLAFGASRPGSAEWHARGPALRGDVDGDGKLDTAVIEYGPPRTCRFRLLIRSGKGALEARVRPDICNNKPAEVYAGPDPHVDVLADVDGKAGLEIVVQMWRGAHTEFAELWTVRDARLQRFSGREARLLYGGSVGTGQHVVDCAREPGLVVISTQAYQPPAKIFRTWYRADGLRLQRVRRRAIRWPAEKAVPFREFGYPQPFPTCAKARAPR